MTRTHPNKTMKKKKKTPGNDKKRKLDDDDGETATKKKKKRHHHWTHVFRRLLNKTEKTTYKCKIRDVKITYKKNIKKHLMSKRHAQGRKENITTNDETIQVKIGARDDIQELPFCRKTNDEENRKGKHFMIEVQKPIKYKFSERLVKYMHVYMDCQKHFRSAGLLRRHRLTDGHHADDGKENYKNWKGKNAKEDI